MELQRPDNLQVRRQLRIIFGRQYPEQAFALHPHFARALCHA